MGELFDVYVAVDWSAKSTPSPARPSPDAIWVGEKGTQSNGDRFQEETYWRTRSACREFIEEKLSQYIADGRRVFLGFDFAYGYPNGFAKSIGLSNDIPPWRATWMELASLIVDRPDNSNNRFEVAAELNSRCGPAVPGPFWGCPEARACTTLEMKSPRSGYPYPVSESVSIDRWRWVDKREPGIQPIWKLIGSGSVGGQCLVGIPTVAYLRFRSSVAPVSMVWPFETGFTATPVGAKGPLVLHAEIWPSISPSSYDPTLKIKDQAQVRAVVQWLSGADGAHELGRLFDYPEGLPNEGVLASTQEEGWIIGGGATGTRQRVSNKAKSSLQEVLPFDV